MSCTIFEILDVEEYHDFEIQVRGHSRPANLCMICTWLKSTTTTDQGLSLCCR